MLLVAAGLMGSLSFFNCYAMQVRDEEEARKVMKMYFNMSQEDEEENNEENNNSKSPVLGMKQNKDFVSSSKKYKIKEEIDFLKEQNKLLEEKKRMLAAENEIKISDHSKAVKEIEKSIEFFNNCIDELDNQMEMEERKNKHLVDKVDKWYEIFCDLEEKRKGGVRLEENVYDVKNMNNELVPYGIKNFYINPDIKEYENDNLYDDYKYKYWNIYN